MRAGFFIKLINFSNAGMQFFKKHMDIEEKPFRAIGVVVMFFITILYALGVVVLLV